MTRRGNPVTRREFLAEGSGVALGVGFGVSSEWQIAQSPGLSVSNDLMRAEWSLTDGVLRGGKVTDLTSGATLALPPDLFSLQLQDGSVIPATALRVVKTSTHTLGPQSRASRLAERLPGRELLVTLRHPDGRLRATWHAILRDGSRYLRQEVQLEALGHDLPVREIRMLELNVAGGSGPEIVGSVRGSPAVSGDWFFGFEHPLSESRVDGSRVRCILTRELPLRVGTAVTGSSVIGVAPRAQRRRAFLGYVERERAHPYRPFLHYNSWYDIGYFSSFDEAAALAVVEAFGTELHQRRSVVLDSFLFDDGWDDHQTLWHFNRGFPRGFTRVREAAARYGAAPGVWLSPWGGYGKPHDERIAAGKAQGYETIGNGFALSGPAYYRRFRETCLEMIHKYGVNQFKFDGTGNAAHVFPGSLFDSDFDAMLALIADLRHERPDLYVNLTTGTYPSPFFLRSCDSI